MFIASSKSSLEKSGHNLSINKNSEYTDCHAKNPLNLNSPNYVWNSSADKIFVYYKRQPEKAVGGTASQFSTGSLGLAGGSGFLFGAVVTAFALNKKKKKPAMA